MTAVSTGVEGRFDGRRLAPDRHEMGHTRHAGFPEDRRTFGGMNDSPLADTTPTGRRRTARGGLPLLTLLVTLFMGLAFAQDRPAWLVEDGSAVLQPFAHPASIQASDAALIVACDANAPEGLNVGLVFGSYGVAVPGEVDVLVRRDRDPPRRAVWFTDEATTGLPRSFAEVGNLLADLRFGGVLAVRVFLFGGVEDAQQPTFQFGVGDFGAVERQLGCSSAAAADDPFADAPSAQPATPAPAAPAPAAPSTPAAPAAPSRGGSAAPAASAVAWDVMGSGRDRLAFAADADATLIGTCEYETQLPIAVLILEPGAPTAGRPFTVRFGAAGPYDAVDQGDGFYQVAVQGDFLAAGDALFSAGQSPAGFDLIATFADGSQVVLLQAAGGESFLAAWSALPCAGAAVLSPSSPATSSSAPSRPAPSTRAPAAPAASSSGSWTLEEDGQLLSFVDARGYRFGFVCTAVDADPVIYLQLSDVPVSASADGLASFSFARANGAGGSADWNFIDAGGGLFYTDDVATNDIGLRLLPDEGSDVWNDVNVSVAGVGTVLTAVGEERVAELYGQLTCVR